jgi:hypothetical protein
MDFEDSAASSFITVGTSAPAADEAPPTVASMSNADAITLVQQFLSDLGLEKTLKCLVEERYGRVTPTTTSCCSPC